MRAAVNLKSWVLPTLAIVMSCLAWVAAILMVANSLGDVFHENPVREEELRNQARFISMAAMYAFLGLLVLSGWLAGFLFKENRFTSWAVLVIHGAMISSALIFIHQT